MNSYDKWTEYLDGELKPDKSFDIIKRLTIKSQV